MPTLAMAAQLPAVEAIRDFVEQAARDAGLGEPVIYRLTLAVEELTTNTVIHGYAEQGRSGEVRVSTELLADRLVVVLEDQGVPFDPTGANLPSAAALTLGMDERVPGGLGILLALRGVDGFRYEYAHGRNRSHLEMRRDAAAPAIDPNDPPA